MKLFFFPDLKKLISFHLIEKLSIDRVKKYTAIFLPDCFFKWIKSVFPASTTKLDCIKILLTVFYFVWSQSLFSQSDEIERVKITAAKALEEGQNEIAIKYHRELLRLLQDAGEKSRIWLNLVSLLIEIGSNDEAQKELEEFEKNFSGQIASDPELRVNCAYLKSAIYFTKEKNEEALQRLLSLVEPMALPNKELNSKILLSIAIYYFHAEKWDDSYKYIKRIENEAGTKEWQQIANSLKVLIAESTGKNITKLSKIPDISEATTLSDIALIYSSGQREKALNLFDKFIENPVLYSLSNQYALWALSFSALQKSDYISAVKFLALSDKISAKTAIKCSFTIMRAELKYALGEKKESVQILRDLLRDYPFAPNSYQISLKLIQILLELEQKDEAFLEYKRNLKVVEEKDFLNYSVQASRIFISHKAFDSAEFSISEISKSNLDSKNEFSECLNGELLFAKGKYKESALTFAKIAKNYPQRYQEAILWQIRAHYKNSDFSTLNSLIDSIYDEISKSEKFQEVLYYKAMSAKKAKKNDIAVNLLKSFAEKYPNSPFTLECLMELADLYFDEKDYDNAIKCYSDIAEKYKDSPSSKISIYKKIYAQVLKADFASAEKTVYSLIEKHPKSEEAANAFLWLADFKRNNNKRDEAEKLYLTIKDKYSEFKEIAADALFEAAKIAISAKDLQYGFLLLDELSEKFPDTNACYEGFFFRGDTLSESADYEKAIIFYTKAAMKKPDSALAISSYGRLGDSYMAIGAEDKEKILKASEFFKKVLENKESPISAKEQALYKLGRCEDKLGDFGAALKNYRELILLFQTDWQRGIKRNTLWLAKAAIEAIRIYLLKGDANSVSEAEKIYNDVYKFAPDEIKQMEENIKNSKEKLRIKESIK